MKVTINDKEHVLVKINHNSFHDTEKIYYFRKVSKDYIKEWKTNGFWKQIKEFVAPNFYINLVTIEGNLYYVHAYNSNFEKVTVDDREKVESFLEEFSRIDIKYYKRTRILNAFYKYEYPFKQSDEYKNNRAQYDWMLGYIQRTISEYIRNKFVLSHNLPINRNLCKFEGNIYFLDVEEIGANIEGWDLAVYHNANHFPIDKNEHELRQVHAFIWWMKYYSLSKHDQEREINIKHYANLRSIWEETFSNNKFQAEYWDKNSPEYKYFNMITKGENVSRINELIIFHKYWTRELFLRQYIYEEAKVKYRHEFKETPLYKKYGRLRNNVVHRLREDEFHKMYNTLDKYFNLFYEVVKDLHKVYGVEKRRFISLVDKIKFNKYLIDYKQRIKIVNFVQERFVDLKIVERGEMSDF